MKWVPLTQQETRDLNARAQLRLFAAMSIDDVVRYLAAEAALENTQQNTRNSLTHRDPP